MYLNGNVTEHLCNGLNVYCKQCESQIIKLAKKLQPKIKGHGVVAEYIGNGWNVYCKQVLKDRVKEECWEASVFIDDDEYIRYTKQHHKEI